MAFLYFCLAPKCLWERSSDNEACRSMPWVVG